MVVSNGKPSGISFTLVDMMAEDIDDGKTIQMGEFGLFRPTIKTKSADTEDAVKASNILSKRIVFTPGKI